MQKGIRVKVDKSKCIGCGTCAALAYDVFKLNYEGYADINEQFKALTITDEAIIAKIKTTIHACPTRAIEIEEL